MKKKSKNVIAEYQTEYKGQTITVKKVKAKERKAVNNGRANFTSCPNCLSSIALDKDGLQKCSGDKLDNWNKEFEKFNELDKQKQYEYLKNISFDSMFMELYDRWNYAKTNPDDTFGCGYTNKIFIPVTSSQVIIPDPAKIHYVEKKLGRKLKEEEILGEIELYEHRGSIFEKYRKGCKIVKIAMIRFPEDCY